jgi:hypothetical protein
VPSRIVFKENNAMNEFIELARFLDEAGYEIAEFNNERYEKERDRDKTYSSRGISLRVVRVKFPAADGKPSENPI